MRIFAWCDSPAAPTGFGRSANHVLYALHEAGHELTQLAVNTDMHEVFDIPWRTVVPMDRANDSYGMNDLAEAVQRAEPDALWTTFDPQVPFGYKVGSIREEVSALDLFKGLRQARPGFRMLGWFPIDGGPLSDMDLGMLGLSNFFDVTATMSPHVYDLIAWTLRLKGHTAESGEAIDMDAIRDSLLVIPHGVELDRYRIPSRQEKRAAKERMGYDPDVFLVVSVERNQQRKQNYMGLDTMKQLFKRQPQLRGKVKLYQHMQQDEESMGCRVGFNLPELSWRFGLEAGVDVRWAPGWAPEEELPRTIYAAADAFLSTSTGEGFQYPAWEALACGVPLVVPNDSAREAWFQKAPNVQLYKVIPHSRVLPQGYGRLMSTPLPAEAAAAIRKLVKQGGVKRRQAEAGRAFVAEHADHKDVTARWVELVAEQEEQLKEERKSMKVVVPGDTDGKRTLQVEMLHAPGLGDLVLAAPVLQALKRMNPERELRLRIPRSHLEIAVLLKLADMYDVQNVDEADERMAIHDLYYPEHRDGWSDPRTHRTEVIARHLGVPLDQLRPLEVQLEEAHQKAVRAQFLEAFGVDPIECVAVAMESGSPHRAMPRTYVPELCHRIKSMGAIPLVVGATGLGVRLHGTLDLSGQTDPLYWIGLMDAVGAVITTDSATLHVAAMMGTPVVAAFPTFDPEARLRYYSGPMRAVVPPDGIVEAGEAWPAGKAPKAPPGTWARHISVDTMMEALGQLMDVGVPAEPVLLEPTQ